MGTLTELLTVALLFAVLYAGFQPWIDAAENPQPEENKGDTNS